ncbi:MAG: hypothetical protein UV67_C0007G0002 [Parcubacteria group bacterium GW2011_GWC1_43_12]|nr:MAG: hypothetical protein UV34_C0036G0008 [Parcubacteria group bacterium GW2011_GWB1_42_6]KKS92236.1 MAG: hypothetical protein UV67_C0007G0002 [Parcubacteria group bacterium GW2011_GWC1_43_12]
MRQIICILLALGIAFQGSGCAANKPKLVRSWEETDKNQERTNLDPKFKEDKIGRIESKVIAKPEIKIKTSISQERENWLKLTPRRTVAQAEDRARQLNLTIISLDRDIAVKTMGQGGKWYIGRIPPNTLFFAKKTESEDGSWIYEVRELGRCGNPVEDLTVILYPGKELTVKAYTDTIEKTVIEEYRDKEVRIYEKTRHSKWPWIIAGAFAAGMIACLLTRHRDRDRPKPQSDPCPPDGSPAPM